MRGNFFDKHVAQCVGNIRKKVEGMYIFVICHLCRSYSRNYNNSQNI